MKEKEITVCGMINFQEKDVLMMYRLVAVIKVVISGNVVHVEPMERVEIGVRNVTAAFRCKATGLEEVVTGKDEPDIESVLRFPAPISLERGVFISFGN